MDLSQISLISVLVGCVGTVLIALHLNKCFFLQDILIAGYLFVVLIVSYIIPLFDFDISIPVAAFFRILVWAIYIFSFVIGGTFFILFPEVLNNIVMGVGVGFSLFLTLSGIWHFSGNYDLYYICLTVAIAPFPLWMYLNKHYKRVVSSFKLTYLFGIMWHMCLDPYAGVCMLEEWTAAFRGSQVTHSTDKCNYMNSCLMLIHTTVIWIICFELYCHYYYRSSSDGYVTIDGNEKAHSQINKSSGAAKGGGQTLKQRTFSYPDTMIHNYFDPDNSPSVIRHSNRAEGKTPDFAVFQADFSHSILLTAQALEDIFGFQVDNCRNQAEHVLMMLYNETVDVDDSSAEAVNGSPFISASMRLHEKLFANYQKWCLRVGVTPQFMKMKSQMGLASSSHMNDDGNVPIHSSSPSSSLASATNASLIADMLLYLLIWGESGNLRHMPECVCFLFHKTMTEHPSSIYRLFPFTSQSPSVSVPYKRYQGYFLDMIVTPMYEAVATSVQAGKGDHCDKKIYDDYNEFFWSCQCLDFYVWWDKSIADSSTDTVPEVSYMSNSYQGSDGAAGLSNRDDGLGSSTAIGKKREQIAIGLKTCSKTFIEKRTWVMPLLTLHRIFEWNVVTFTFLVISGMATHLVWDAAFYHQVVSVLFMEIVFLQILWTVLEVWSMFPISNMSKVSLLGYGLRLSTYTSVLVYLALFYNWSFGNTSQQDFPLNDVTYSVMSSFQLRQSAGSSQFWWWQYIYLSSMTLLLYFFESVMCWFPSFVSALLTADIDVVQIVLDMCYPLSQAYVAKKLHVSQLETLKYIAFWVSLLSFKLWFSYSFVVFPIIEPSITLYDDYMNFGGEFPFGKTLVLISVWWFPHFLVYLVDLSIWFAVWSSLLGGFAALIERQGAIREIVSLRSHFFRSPIAFCQKLMPTQSKVSVRSSVFASTASLTSIATLVQDQQDQLSREVAVAKANQSTYSYLSTALNGTYGGGQKSIDGLAATDGFAHFNVAVQTSSLLRDHSASSLSSNASNKVSTLEFPSSDVEDGIGYVDNGSDNNIPGHYNRGSNTMMGFLDIRSQRWVVFSRIWNEIIVKLRQQDHMSNKQREYYLFSNFSWLRKPVYLPLFQTVGRVDATVQDTVATYELYSSTTDTSQKDSILLQFQRRMNTTTLEALNETWELGSWLLGLVLGPTHTQDVNTIVAVIDRWCTGGDAFTYMHFSSSNLNSIISHVGNITSILEGCYKKRIKRPIVREDAEDPLVDEAPLSSKSKPELGLKKSISSGFLNGLGVSPEENGDGVALMRDQVGDEQPLHDSKHDANSQKVDELQHSYQNMESDYVRPTPFRKTTIEVGGALFDTVRDKLRDEVNSLLATVRSCIQQKIYKKESHQSEKSTLMSSYAFDNSVSVIDCINRIQSIETGFLLSNHYASLNIDEMANDERLPTALLKLHGLLKFRLPDVELPASSEAHRRLHFFVNSLFMDIPVTPCISQAKEYTCLTPYYSEDVLLTKADLELENSDGITTILYLQTLYNQEWLNFLERCEVGDDSLWNKKHLLELRMWASLRAQTLFRTVEGVMQSEAAIRMTVELEQLEANQKQTHRRQSKQYNEVAAHESSADVLSKLKFTYVVTAQIYGHMMKTGDTKKDDIDFLLKRHPNLRVAYIDCIRGGDRAQHSISRNNVALSNGAAQSSASKAKPAGDTGTCYYSVLIKYNDSPQSSDANLNPNSTSTEPVGIQEVYRIKLPGNPILGEGKPENQNHAIVFTRGRYLQAVDMNQDGYFEEALKMRSLLQEFNTGCTILGFREHIFTGSVSSVANYMALQELSFVTLGQRVLCRLHIRQHYGHPDLFDKMFVMTEGGMSKASRGINLSEDVFAGFNATLRSKTVGYREYVQAGKGRDVGLQQTYKFEAKLAQGNAEQALSRDMNRICDRLDFFRLFSFYYGGIGHYVSGAIVMFTLAVVVNTLLILAIFNEEGVNGRTMHPEGVLQIALAGVGLLQTLPLAVTLFVEKGFGACLSELAFMILSGGPLYFVFHIQTKSYYFQQTLLAGGAKYRPTGRGFVIRHSPFDENYRFFASSHFYWGFELFVSLVIYSYCTVSKQVFGITWSLWLVCLAFLLSPFWFNPLSFDWDRVIEDYNQWRRWMEESSTRSVEQSWSVWWKDENGFWKDLSLLWKVQLAVQKSGIWAVIGFGLLGRNFFSNRVAQLNLLGVLGLIGCLFVCRWFLRQLQGSFSYAIRRLISMVLYTTLATSLACVLFLHPVLLRYLVSVYYFAASICFLLLLCGVRSVEKAYQFHDYLVGHFLFLLIGIPSLFKIGSLQTWLLYHNALKANIVIDNILKHARRSKELADKNQVDEAHTLTSPVAPLSPLVPEIPDSYRTMQQMNAKIEKQEKQIQSLLELVERKEYVGVGTSKPHLNREAVDNSQQSFLIDLQSVKSVTSDDSSNSPAPRNHTPFLPKIAKAALQSVQVRPASIDATAVSNAAGEVAVPGDLPNSIDELGFNDSVMSPTTTLLSYSRATSDGDEGAYGVFDSRAGATDDCATSPFPYLVVSPRSSSAYIPPEAEEDVSVNTESEVVTNPDQSAPPHVIGGDSGVDGAVTVQRESVLITEEKVVVQKEADTSISSVVDAPTESAAVPSPLASDTSNNINDSLNKLLSLTANELNVVVEADNSNDMSVAKDPGESWDSLYDVAGLAKEQGEKVVSNPNPNFNTATDESVPSDHNNNKSEPVSSLEPDNDTVATVDTVSSSGNTGSLSAIKMSSNPLRKTKKKNTGRSDVPTVVTANDTPVLTAAPAPVLRTVAFPANVTHTNPHVGGKGKAKAPIIRKPMASSAQAVSNVPATDSNPTAPSVDQPLVFLQPEKFPSRDASDATLSSRTVLVPSLNRSVSAPVAVAATDAPLIFSQPVHFPSRDQEYK